MQNASLDQAGFRFRNDDGNETSATWVESENVDASIAPSTIFRLRLVVDDTASGAENNVSTQWQYNLNGAGWNDVTTGSSVLQAATSTQGTLDGTATTRQLTSGSGTFVSAEVTEDGLSDSVRPTFADGTDDVTELELVCQIIDADVSGSDTIDVRVVRSNGTLLEAYSQTPRVTVDAATVHNLTPNDAAHSHTADSPAITQVHSLAPDDGLHSHTADSPTLTEIDFFPPSGLTATAQSNTEILLEWDAVSTATGYDIERDSVVIEEDHATTSFTDSGLTADTQYQYRVRAVQAV